jgi:hypothetical protein
MTIQVLLGRKFHTVKEDETGEEYVTIDGKKVLLKDTNWTRCKTEAFTFQMR